MTDDHRFGILGGSFNPPHVGHLRLAVEVLERLDLPRLELMPCYRPPHKEDGALLPFALRARCLALALGIEGGAPRLHGLELNTMEQERPGPSYTIDTLAAYRERDPLGLPYFILGAGDLLTLESWKQGLELPFHATLVVVPRERDDLDAVRGFVRTHWPEARRKTPPRHALAAWSIPQASPEHGLIYLPLPRMDVSGDMIRRAWVEGRILRGLVPECVELELLRQESAVSRIWGPRGARAPRG